MDIDHVFVAVADLAGAERALAECDVQFGLHAIHQGQGTANACAFFDNGYLELLAPHDDRELRSPRVRPLALWERLHWRESGASPFGIALRANDRASAVETWPYEAPFLPSGLAIPIVTPPHMPSQPLIVLITPSLPIRLRTPTAHRGKPRRLTRVRVCGPGLATLSGRVGALVSSSALQLTDGVSHGLDLEWDDGVAGESFAVGPTVPLTLRW